MQNTSNAARNDYAAQPDLKVVEPVIANIPKPKLTDPERTAKWSRRLRNPYRSAKNLARLILYRVLLENSEPLFALADKIFTPVRKVAESAFSFRSNVYAKQIDIVLDLAHTRKLLGNEAADHLDSLIRAPFQSYREALKNIAEFLCRAGLPDQGIAAYEALLQTYGDPKSAPEAVVVIYLQMMMFGSPEIQTNEHIYKQHVYWSSRFASDREYKTYANPLTTDRRLKVGYTCHFITNSTSMTLLQPFLGAHHRDRVEVFMYSDEPVNAKTAGIQNLVENWRNTYGLSNDDFCELVRKDGIDILLELNGHCIINRYPAIGRRPAPVQVAYYNYANTTGVPGIDYSLCSDDIEVEPMQPYYSETVIRKRGSLNAMVVGDHFPDVSPPPFEKNGYITFCSFGQAHKVSRKQVLLWCEVLKRVPNSKFFMKAEVLAYPPNRAAFVNHFKDGGIDESRLILEGNSSYDELLQRCYAMVDIALDTYPYNAGTTTIEAIIQGIPVISCVGERYASQIGRGNLESVDHTEMLCYSDKEFVEKAVALANDPDQLRHYRKTLRDDFRASRRADLSRFTHELEDVFEEMWRRYLAKHQKG